MYLDNLQGQLVTVRWVWYLVGRADNGKEFLHVVGDVLKGCLLVDHQVDDATQRPHVGVPSDLDQRTEEGDHPVCMCVCMCVCVVHTSGNTG